jgi:hypothetical protein
VQVELRQLTLRIVNHESRNDLTVIAGLFDHNGVYLGARRSILRLKLSDDTMQKICGPLTDQVGLRREAGNLLRPPRPPRLP